MADRMYWVKDLKPHPLAVKLLPSLTEDEFEALKESIETAGVMVPIMICDGEILDGVHRWKACQAIGRREIPATRHPGPTEEELLDIVLGLNTRRRNLNGFQKREIVSNMLGDYADRSDRWIARAVGVSPTFVGNVRRELEDVGEIHHVERRISADGVTRPATPKTVASNGQVELESAPDIPFADRGDQSKAAYGVRGLPIWAIQKLQRGSERWKRYEDPLRALTDRQLLRRWERYLRQAEAAQDWADDTAGLGNACGLRNQMCGRLHVAYRLLSQRGITNPSRVDAYRAVPSSELLLEMQEFPGLLEELADSELRDVRAQLEDELSGRPHDQLLNQKHRMIIAEIEGREAGGDDLDRIARNLEEKIGWRLRRSEVRRLMVASQVEIEGTA